jgi:PPOX class probable F420-dependent enzyme
VTGSAVVTLSTLNRDSSIQSTAIWIHHGEDGVLRASLAKSRQKYRNLLRQPLATVFALSGADPFHSLEVRANVELADDPDRAFLAELLVPYGQTLERFGAEERVVVTFKPIRVRVTG